jgi:hypothetical protein
MDLLPLDARRRFRRQFLREKSAPLHSGEPESGA